MSCSFQSLTSEDGVSVTDVLMLALKLVYICKLSLVLSSQLEGKFAPSAGHNVKVETMCAVAVLPANSGTSSTTSSAKLLSTSADPQQQRHFPQSTGLSLREDEGSLHSAQGQHQR